jgi:hypothetical protein
MEMKQRIQPGILVEAMPCHNGTLALYSLNVLVLLTGRRLGNLKHFQTETLQNI